MTKLQRLLKESGRKFIVILKMPIYLYKAEKKGCFLCKKGIEVFQKRGEKELERCPLCGEKLKKVFAPFSIGFSKSGLERRAKEAGFHKLKKVDKGKYEKIY